MFLGKKKLLTLSSDFLNYLLFNSYNKIITKEKPKINRKICEQKLKTIFFSETGFPSKQELNEKLQKQQLKIF